MFPVPGGVFPSELSQCIMSNLDRKDLENVRYVSQKWNLVEGLDETWRGLFFRFFLENAPLNISAKTSFFKRHGLPISNMEVLCNAYTTFRCNLDWNKKKCFSVFFPTLHYTAIFEVALGPERGTPEGFQAPADEFIYYRYVADPPEDLKEIKETVTREFNIAGIPMRKSSKGNFNNYYFPRCFSAKIGNVDVGYGNTLGYFSSINDWKTPFKLFCVSNSSGGHSWNGHIPYGSFKFVKIGPDGSITWEIHTGPDQNRLRTARTGKRICSWERHLEYFPIRFPN